MALYCLSCSCGSAKADDSYYKTDASASEKQALLPNDKDHHSSSSNNLAQQPRRVASLTVPPTIAEARTIACRAVEDLVRGDPTTLVNLDNRIRGKNYEGASWAEAIARNVLERLAEAIKPGSVLGDVLREAYEKARSVAIQSFNFAQEHPVLTIVIALGILCLLTPGIVNMLGFTARGVAAGSWAARWQSMYGGFVDAGSLFSYLQRFGALYG